MYDVIIVGSGPAGISSAWPLVKAKKKVIMIDVGFTHSNNSNSVNKTLFRSSSPKIVSPEFSFVFNRFKELNKIKTSNFSAHGSLAKGGLSNAWSALVSSFTEEELSKFPISRKDLLPFYLSTAQRIGISGTKKSDLSNWLGNEYITQPNLPIHPLAQKLLQNHKNSNIKLDNIDFKMDRHNQAILSKKFKNRKAFDLNNIHGFKDLGDSVYNSADELKQLSKYKNFNYKSGQYVHDIEQNDNFIELKSELIFSKEVIKIRSKILILAAGTIGTTKLVLKFKKHFNKPISLLNTPMFPFALFFPLELRRKVSFKSFSFWHLSYYLGLSEIESNHKIYGHLAPTDGMSYRYLSENLNLPSSIRNFLSKFLWPKMMVGTCIFPGVFSDNTIILDSNGELKIIGETRSEFKELAPRVKSILSKIFFKFGAILKVKSLSINPGEDIHYAGTIPMRMKPNNLEVDSNGLLSGNGNIYLVDGSILSDLPAKSHTFTVMANSSRIASLILKRL